MVRVKQPLFSLRSRGTFGPIVYQGRPGRATARPLIRPTKKRTGPQKAQGERFKAAIAFWHRFGPGRRYRWKRHADRLRITEYNYCLRQHIRGELGSGRVFGSVLYDKITRADLQ